MPAFKVKGGTGQAPITTFFGAVPDKFNMLLPGHPAENPPRATIDSAFAANFVNTWTVYNPTFWGGSNTASASFTTGQTAPDGTTTAVKMVESTLNDIHMVTAGWIYSGGFTGNLPQKTGVYRSAVFAKAAERTRFSLAFGANGNHSGGGYQNLAQGTRVIFDLAGGQVGQAAANFGSPATPWTVQAASILPFGNGWYLCQIDVSIGSHQGTENGLYCGIIIDAGSGTAVEDTSYAGDGSSGVLFWRACHLPAQAWGMGMNPVFADDFNDNTMAEFDVNNTLAPGFKWYYNGNWAGPGYRTSDGCLTPIPPTFFTVSNSAINLPNSQGNVAPFGNYQAYLLSPAAWLGGTSVLGQLFYSPMVVEEVVAWGTGSNTAIPGGAGGNFFTDASPKGQLLTPNAAIGAIGFSWSPVETLFNISSSTTMFAGPNMGAPPGPAGQFNSIEWMQNITASRAVYGIWYNAISYHGSIGNFVVDTFDGNIYKNIGTPIVGTPPHSDPTNWALYNPVPDGFPSLANSIVFDYTQYHTYVTIWLKTDPIYGPGHMMTFVDGNFGTYVGSYSKNNPPFLAENLGGNLFLLSAQNYSMTCDRMAIYG